MALVKGSKQFDMVVVKNRPLYWLLVNTTAITVLVVLGLSSFYYGKNEGLSLKTEVIQEKDDLIKKLSRSETSVRRMRQKIADLNLGTEVDQKANEAVRTEVESLQQHVADLNEEVKFYKSVLMPNVEEKGLRIERLDVKGTADPNKIRYDLLLTQVMEVHQYIQGDVKMQLVGKKNNEEVTVSLESLSEVSDKPIRFKFKYFQNLNGEFILPKDFIPMEIMVVVNSSNKGNRRIERRFDWQLSEG